MRVVILKNFAKEHFPSTPLTDYACQVELVTTSKVCSVFCCHSVAWLLLCCVDWKVWWKIFHNDLLLAHGIWIVLSHFDFRYCWRWQSQAFVFRLHYLHCMRCGLLLQMLHIAWSVCLLVTHMCCGKTAEPIENGNAIGWEADSCWFKEPYRR